MENSQSLQLLVFVLISSMNIYKLTHTATCPNGNLEDYYEITISSSKIIQVEDILLALSNAPKEIYQEELTDYIRSKLPAKISTVGYHHGVEITCVRG